MPVSTTWLDYVDNWLVGSGYAKEAAICAIDKPMKWGASKGFDMSTLEHKALVKAFTDSSEVRWHGLYVNDAKYTCVRSDIDLLIGRQTGGGCIVVKCRKCIVMCLYDDPYEANCWNLAFKLAAYLREMGF